jgi:hypothetical protein
MSDSRANAPVGPPLRERFGTREDARKEHVLFVGPVGILHYSAPGHWDERAQLAEECATWPRRGVSGQTLGQVLWYCGCLQLAQGEAGAALLQSRLSSRCACVRYYAPTGGQSLAGWMVPSRAAMESC